MRPTLRFEWWMLPLAALIAAAFSMAAGLVYGRTIGIIIGVTAAALATLAWAQRRGSSGG